MPASHRNDSGVARMVRAVGQRPDLWATVLVAIRRHVPRQWWPRSAEPWLRFRVETAYGDERSTPTDSDVVTWLEWLRDRRR